ncbi:hypothetical protein [Streptomyces nojiriensis]|uniref:hypothetical protein n=1 Tax=Streptomyces nojiriensis TaxID=66374 RepID=UPI003663E8F9
MPANPPPRRAVPRRLFLRMSGAAGVVIGAAVAGGAGLLAGPAARSVELPVRTTYLRRRDDMLNLRISLVNLHIADPAAPRLTKAMTDQPAYLVVDFGPQAAQERAFPDPGPPGQAPVRLEWGGASRLAFDVSDHLPLPYTTEALLGWAGFGPRLVPNARGRTVPGDFSGILRAPTSQETALEVPYGVIVSPDSTGGWCHVEAAAVPDSPSGWTELWHTRLGTRAYDEDRERWVAAETGASQVLRAVWMPDPRFPGWLAAPGAVPDSGAFPTSLSPRNRYDLVRLSSDFSLASPLSALPAPIEADALSLSALGATLDAHGAWDTTGSGFTSGLAEWSHLLTQGRDQKVRVVQHGYLLPFGHRAAFVQVTEREIVRDDGGAVGGYLRTRVFLVVLQAERDYAADPHTPAAGRALPFRRIRALTRTTTGLDSPAGDGYVPSSAPPAAGSARAFAFLAKSGSVPLPLHFVGVDWEGRRVPFTAPVVFVNEQGAADGAFRTAVARQYNTTTAPTDASRLGRIGGPVLALAASSKPGDTSLAVRTLSFAVTAADPATTGVPGFPAVARITAALPGAVRSLAEDPQEAVLAYFPDYLRDGFGSARNTAGVYLAKAEGTVAQALEFAADRSGGIATPGLVLDGLSRKFGPVAGDLAQAARERFDPARMFDGLDVRILGGIRLQDVLRAPADGAANAEQALQVVSEEFHRVVDGVRVPERAEARLTWRPQLKAGPGSLGMFVPGARGRLDIEAVSAVRLLPPLDATYSVRGELGDVSLNIWGDSGAAHFVTVGIRSLRFTAAKGRTADIDCELGAVSFHGPLKYLEEVARLCRLSGPGSPLSVAVVGRQIQAELSLALPSLAFGVFALDSMTLFAGLYLPFDGSPVRLRFALNSRDAPFGLTLSFLGGGGFFALEAGADGVESLEVALEAGAGTAFDVAGVVSGHVEAKVGVYFGVRTVPAGDGTAQEVELSAYVRLGGRVEVLGLVSASLDCYLALTYYSGPDRLVGEASVTFSIDLCLFETSVSFHVRRELAGGGTGSGTTTAGARASRASARPARQSPPQPTRSTAAATATAAAAGAAGHGFGDAYGQQDWTSYCTAFAPMGA